MNRSISFICIASAMALWCLLPAGAEEKKGKGKKEGGDLEHLMERTHEGRRSPFGQFKAQLAADKTDWDVLAKQLPALQAMAKALKETKNADVQQLSDGYIDSVKALATATDKKDLDNARASFKKLSASCTDCHFKGGPGGKLEKD